VAPWYPAPSKSESLEIRLSKALEWRAFHLDEKAVQRQLRHADARTTLQIYGHVVGDGHREAVEKVASTLDAIGRRELMGSVT
jgi:integrase